MRRKPLLLIIPFIILSLLSSAFAEDYSATTMRLLRYDGTVQIYDVSGNPRFLLENVRFASGEAMETGEDGTASVSLDDSKIVSLDKQSFVEFLQEADHIRLNLKKGTLFLDVSEKLDENAGLDIQTSTMTVGIRGTVVQVTEEEDPQDPDTLVTELGVMEGITNVTFTDLEGASRLINVSAGQKISIPRKRNAKEKGVNPVVSKMTASDIKPVSMKQITANPSLYDRITKGSPEGENLLQGGAPQSDEEHQEPFPADGKWTYDELVSLVAQSASKLYDGTPLTRPEALVSGLPTGLKIDLKIEGSITDAGTAKNTVTGWTIYNATGENVTGHITNVQTIEGDLKVDPAPIYVWTGSAEKTYDGEPLTCEEAEIHTIAGRIATDPDWKNSSVITRTALGSEQMIGLAGNTLVHGSNPLTGEVKETTLPAGYALTVSIRSSGTGDTIVYGQVKLSEDQLPLEVVRLYADNPDLLAAACAETNWDPEKILARVKSSGAALTTENGLKVTGEESGNIVINSTNVRIQVDSDFTSYDSRALGGNEAKFSPIRVDKAITVTATGSQLEIGESKNTCSIEWNGVNPKNYDVRQDLGTLTVLPPENDKPVVYINSGSGSKTYDGTPLEVSTLSASGLPAGYRALAIYSGKQTSVGSSRNVMSSVTILDDTDENVTDQFRIVHNPGTLTVTPAELTVTTGSAEKNYDGEALTCDEASLSGLVSGDSATVTATGSQTDVGSSENTYTITWTSGSESNYTITENLGTLEVKPADDFSAAITITAASATAEYNGQELQTADYTVTGLPSGYDATAEIDGGQTDAGSSANRIVFYQITKDGEDYTSRFTNVTLEDGTLTVTPYVLSFDCGGTTYTFQDELLVPAVSCNGMSKTGDKDGAGYVEAAFELADTGDTVYLQMSNYPVDCMEIGDFNVGAGFDVDPGDPGNYTASFTNTVITVKKRAVKVSKASESRVYDGKPGPKTTDVIIDGDINGVVEASLDNSDELGPDVGDYPFEIYTHVDYDCIEGIDLDKSGVGKLTITPADLDITSPEQHFTYDGEEHFLDDEDVVISGLADGDEIEFSLDNLTVTKGGEAIQPDGGIEWLGTNPDNYTPNISLGKIYVDKAPLTITSGDAEKTYDGTPLMSEVIAYQYTSGTLYGEDIIRVRLTGSQTEVGEGENTFEIDYENSVNADCYDITKVYGTLTVNPAPENTDNGKISVSVDFTPLDVYNIDYYFEATCSVDGETLVFSGSTSNGGRNYQGTCTLANGDTATLTVANLPLHTDAEGTYTIDLDCDIAGSSGDEYDITYAHNTISVHNSAP